MISGMQTLDKSTVHLEWLLLPPAWQGSHRAWSTHRRCQGKEEEARGPSSFWMPQAFLFTHREEQAHARRPPREVPLSSPPAGSRALDLHPGSLVQDVFQQPVDHVQSLVLLQHDVIGVQVALTLFLHLVI